jgi:mRNA interferase MazF
MKKTRLVLVISSDAAGVLPIKLGVPITEWQPSFENHLWHIRLEPDNKNGLTKRSAMDVLQTRALAVERIRRRIGVANHETVEVAAAIGRSSNITD